MTLKKITMPQLGESVTEGTITSWLVSTGDFVNKYDPIAEVITDKVTAEIPSSYSGTIAEILVNVDETVEVGVDICTITTAEQSDSEQKETVNGQANLEQENQDESMKKRYSPAVLMLAQSNDIDLSQITGTGRGGRITRKDVEKVIGSTKFEQSTKHVDKPVEKKPLLKDSNRKEQPISILQPGDKEIPVTGVRKAIAEKMVRSKQEIPHAWMKVEADVTDLVSLRNAEKERFVEKEGYRLTYFPFFIKAVAQALKEFPQLNSTWAGDKIIQHQNIHITIAVSANDQLYVPVIKHADELSIKGIAKQLAEFTEKANEGKLSVEDVSGGTFAVNNTGAFGSIESMGIINHPQAAILQVETIVKRPVIINDMFAARDMVNLCLSLDHRILDGVVSGQFLAKVKSIVENSTPDNTKIY